MKRRRNTLHPPLLIWVLVFGLVSVITSDSVADLPRDLEFDPIEFRIPPVDTLEFSTGLHGYLIEDHDVPVIDIVIMYRTGFPPKDKVGLAEVASWAIRNGGTLKFTTDVIDDALEFVGASIESESRTYTGEITVNCLTKDITDVLRYLAAIVINPAFEVDKIELRKKSLMEDVRRRTDDPYRLGQTEFSKIVYAGHPAGWEPTVKTISNITRADVVEFHSEYVRPDNAVIGISGDITKEEAVKKLEKFLGDWKPGGGAPVFPDMDYEATPSVNYIYKDVNQAYIFAGHMGMNSSNDDKSAARMMNYILGNGDFSSWIVQRIRTDEGLAYGAGSRFGVTPLGYGLFVGSCQTRADAAMRALTLLIEQIEKMQNEGPTEEEVSDAKDSFVNRHVFDYESPARIINRLAYYAILGLPLDTLEREFRAYQSATLEDVRRVGREYLHPGGLTILVVGNQDLFDRPLSDFGEVNVIEIDQEEGEHNEKE